MEFQIQEKYNKKIFSVSLLKIIIGHIIILEIFW